MMLVTQLQHRIVNQALIALHRVGIVLLSSVKLIIAGSIFIVLLLLVVHGCTMISCTIGSQVFVLLVVAVLVVVPSHVLCVGSQALLSGGAVPGRCTQIKMKLLPSYSNNQAENELIYCYCIEYTIIIGKSSRL